MSYLTGGATDPTDLLDLFEAFLEAAGWVLDAGGVDGTGKAYHLHKGTKYVHLHSFIADNSSTFFGANGGFYGSGIAVLGATGYAAGDWFNQPGAPYMYLQTPGLNVIPSVMPLPAGAISNFWMFADATGDNVVLVALKASGVYTWMCFGDIEKPNGWTGGMYLSASRNYSGAFNPAALGSMGLTAESGPPGSVVGYLQGDFDSIANNWASLDITQCVGASGPNQPGRRMQSSTAPKINSPAETAGDHIAYGAFRLRSKSILTSGLVLLPTWWLVERDFGGAIYGGGWSLAGRLPGIYQCTSDGFVPGSTYTVSTDEYVVFPEFAIQKVA